MANWLTKQRQFTIKRKPLHSIDGTSLLGTTSDLITYTKAYEDIEVVNRCVNMLVDDSTAIPQKVGESIREGKVKGVRKDRVNKLLNSAPNAYQDVSSFRRNLVIDLILDGNIFILYSAGALYHLPAEKVVVEADAEQFIKSFKYLDETYRADEVIWIKDNSFTSLYRGESRLKPATRSINSIIYMRKFQQNFFKNNAVPGLVLKSPNTLSEKIKTRLLASWKQKYNPVSGGRNPLILDGGLEVDSISNHDFHALDFENSITVLEETIGKALGVPPVLLDSGNNANLRPNMRLYYLESVLPITEKINKAIEFYFGFQITNDLIGIPALQPELKDEAAYFSTLVNGGIFTPDEARIGLGKEKLPDGAGAEVRIPANIAGSAGNPGEGGRPDEDSEE